MATPTRLARSIRRLGLAVGLGLALSGAGLLVLVGLAGIVTRPEAFSLGGATVSRAIAAYVGTALPGAIPLALLALGYLVARRLGDRGETAALAGLGLGLMDAWLSLSRLWLGVGLLALVLAMVVEPWAWTSLHALRGTPQAAAVGWARLERGELRVLDGGGAVTLRDGRLHFRSGHGPAEGWFDAPRANSRSAGWDFGRTEVTDASGARWTVEGLELRLLPTVRKRYLAPPTNARTLGPWALVQQASDATQSPRARRSANFVLHRRLALCAGIPVLALLGWVLGWSLTPRDRGRALSGLGLVAVAIGLYGLTRLADHGMGSSHLSPAVAAWLPFGASALALSVFSWNRVRRGA